MHMDKKTALCVLGLLESDSFETARHVYRQLAKKYHPDVLENKSSTSSHSEYKMKEINLAFRSLLPYLKSESVIEKEDKEKLKKRKKAKKTKQVKKDIPFDRFFLTIKKIFFRMVSGIQQKQRSRNPIHPGVKPNPEVHENKDPQKKYDFKINRVKFDDVLNALTMHKIKGFPTTSGKSKSCKGRINVQSGKQNQNQYNHYKKYIKLKKKYQPLSRCRSKGGRVQGIAKIDPISRVKPVEKI